MSRSLIHWNETDELALAAVQSRLQAHSPGRTLSRPDVVKLLVAAAASKVTPESLLMATRDTQPPTEGGA